MAPENRLCSELIEFVLQIVAIESSFETFHLSDDSSQHFETDRNLVVIL